MTRPTDAEMMRLEKFNREGGLRKAALSEFREYHRFALEIGQYVLNAACAVDALGGKARKRSTKISCWTISIEESSEGGYLQGTVFLSRPRGGRRRGIISCSLAVAESFGVAEDDKGEQFDIPDHVVEGARRWAEHNFLIPEVID